MKHIGHPVVGDPIYGSANRSFKSLKGQALHAYRLSFIHPTTKKEMTFVAPPPLYFEGIIDVLRKQV
jgi:23S rRNA pseudouridine1911/1915/1917 synthase